MLRIRIGGSRAVTEIPLIVVVGGVNVTRIGKHYSACYGICSPAETGIARVERCTVGIDVIAVGVVAVLQRIADCQTNEELFLGGIGEDMIGVLFGGRSAVTEIPRPS